MILRPSTALLLCNRLSTACRAFTATASATAPYDEPFVSFERVGATNDALEGLVCS